MRPFKWWMWVALVALAVGLFAPATLLAGGSHGGSSDEDDFETFQPCFNQGQGAQTGFNDGGFSFF
jgi:hypothetical protein